MKEKGKKSNFTLLLEGSEEMATSSEKNENTNEETIEDRYFNRLGRDKDTELINFFKVNSANARRVISCFSKGGNIRRILWNVSNYKKTDFQNMYMSVSESDYYSKAVVKKGSKNDINDFYVALFSIMFRVTYNTAIGFPTLNEKTPWDTTAFSIVWRKRNEVLVSEKKFLDLLKNPSTTQEEKIRPYIVKPNISTAENLYIRFERYSEKYIIIDLCNPNPKTVSRLNSLVMETGDWVSFYYPTLYSDDDLMIYVNTTHAYALNSLLKKNFPWYSSETGWSIIAKNLHRHEFV